MIIRSRFFPLALALLFLILAGQAFAKPYGRAAAPRDIAKSKAPPSPREVLGFEPGEDRKLADWSQILDYFKRLDSASERVSVREAGLSTERRPLIVAIISSEENISNLARIRQAQAKLADPRLIENAAEREQLIRDTPSVVAITCSIHSTEIVASQMAMELAYRLASDTSSATSEILRNTVLLLIPSVNPDGIDIVTSWYRKTLGTKFEGTSPPALYHRYAGHDNNRDWFMLTQVETQIVSRLFWREWFPEIVYDVHQQGQFGSRMCLPPFFDPHNPNIDPVIVRQVGAIGMRMAARLAAAGHKGIVTNSTYDMWWHGGLRSAPYYHNAIGILSEAASANLATPVDIKREQLRAPTRGLQDPLVTATNYPEAWPGGAWRARDILDMELITCRTALEEAALHREELIRNFVNVAERAIEAGRSQSPYAYIVPARQHDQPAAARMINILIQQGVEVHYAKNDFIVAGKNYERGSYVLLLAQPYRANVKCLFEPQRYPDRRVYPGGPAEQPYDVAGWTLPMQMGVDYVEVDRPFDARLEKIEMTATGVVNSGEYVDQLPEATEPDLPTTMYLPADSNNAFAFINDLFKFSDQVTISRLTSATNIDGRSFRAGSFVIGYNPLKKKRANAASQKAAAERLDLSGIRKKAGMRDLGIDLYLAAKGERKSTASSETARVEALTRPRLALYRSWMASMDEGWTRWVLEQFGFDYKNITDADVRAGVLENSFDVIVLPDQSMQQILAGNRPGTYPPEYTGGITDAGAANLKRFVEAGGVLICLNSSSELAIKQFDLPVKNVLDNLRRDQFYAPGSIFRAIADTSHPVAFGMPVEADLYFVSGSRRARGEDPGSEPDATGSPRAETQSRVDPASPESTSRPQSARRGEAAPLVSAFAFEVSDSERARSIARYVEGNPLRSGWLLGPEHIAGKSALLDVSLGKGRVVLFGFRTQHRAQTWGTFKFLFNSIMLGGARQKAAR